MKLPGKSAFPHVATRGQASNAAALVAQSSASLRPHKLEPVRLLYPWDSPGAGNVLCVCVLFSPVRLFATPWTVAHQAPLSVEFSRQEYWSGFPFPSPRNLPDPGIEPGLPELQVDSLPSEPPGIGCLVPKRISRNSYFPPTVLRDLILCNPMYRSLPGSSVHELLQARMLEWIPIAFFFERTESQKRA